MKKRGIEMRAKKLMRESGYITDLIYIFYRHYNKELLDQLLLQIGAEEHRLSEAALSNFSVTSDDLFVFFHAIKNNRSFFAKYFHHIKRSHFITDYNFAYVLNLLSNRSNVIKNLIKFYFYDLSPEEREVCMADNAALMKVIKASEYSPTEKNRLYEFFMDPDGHIQKLQEELIETEKQLALYYETHYGEALELFSKMNLEELVKKLNFFDLEQLEKTDLYVSFSLLNRGLISYFGDETYTYLELGAGYEASLNDLHKIVTTPEDLGTALCDKNRVKMLDLLLEKGEMTCKELEQHFHFSASTAYHHLTTMQRCGVLSTRISGKALYYSVNRPYFTEAIKMLGKYAQEE